MKKGWREPVNAIPPEDEHIVLFLVSAGFQQHSIATLFGVNPGRVSEIVTRRRKKAAKE